MFIKIKFTIKKHTQMFLVRTFFTGLPLKIISGWWGLFLFRENITSCACFKGSGLKLIFHWWAHASIFFKSLLISVAEVFRSRTTENKEVSLAKSFGFEDRFFAKTLIQIRNNSGPKIETWGTPAWIFFELDICPLRTTHCFLFLRKSSKILVSCQISHSALI